MSKKDYEVIAAAIREIDNRYYGKDRERQAIAEIVDTLCGPLWEDNPNFRPRQFKAACGVLS